MYESIYMYIFYIHRTLFWSMLALLPLLCGTWVIGLLVLATIELNGDDESEVLAWIFTVINSLQVCLHVINYLHIFCMCTY